MSNKGVDIFMAKKKNLAYPKGDLVKTIEQEEIEKAVIKVDDRNLQELSELLQKRRDRIAITSREKDLEYVDKIDKKIEDILLNISAEKLQKAGVKDIAIAFGIMLDKREMLLGFDESRQKKKKGIKLQVMWKGDGGGGVQVETE